MPTGTEPCLPILAPLASHVNTLILLSRWYLAFSTHWGSAINLHPDSRNITHELLAWDKATSNQTSNLLLSSHLSGCRLWSKGSWLCEQTVWNLPERRWDWLIGNILHCSKHSAVTCSDMPSRLPAIIIQLCEHWGLLKQATTSKFSVSPI